MSDARPLVCVTGASGFIGAHVTRQLLARGFRVRAAVRDPSHAAKTAHLTALTAGTVDDSALQIVAGDLMNPGSYDGAVADCTYVVHAASPVMISATDPERAIIEPAVRGTRNVLESVVKAGTVKRVVQTSSIAAVYDLTRPEDHVFTESDWNESDAAGGLPYPRSKVLAERAAVDFNRGLPAAEQFELTAINPTFVLGPVDADIHLRTSPSLVRELLDGRLPGQPDFYFNLVDVRDVADAHVRALTHPGDRLAPRYICFGEQLHFTEIAARLSEAFPTRRIPRRAIPNALVYAWALFDKRLTWAYLRKNLGRRIRLDGRLARQNLGVQFRPIAETLIDTAQSMIEHGFAR